MIYESMVHIIKQPENVSGLLLGRRELLIFNGVAKLTFIEAIAVGVLLLNKKICFVLKVRHADLHEKMSTIRDYKIVLSDL